ncbi:MAG: hypothetical protein RLZ98_2657 [Pseudomonadota bacterium]|jgi:molybdopterin molybdotransferase
MADLLPVEQALARILAAAQVMDVEHVSPFEAPGRILAEPLSATRTQPPFHASAMDGYAVRATDVANLPATLRIIGESAAGNRFPGRLERGEAVRIFTGAPLPEGADAIVIQENTTRAGDRVSVVDGIIDPAYVRHRGFDFQDGDSLIPRNVTLNARTVTLAAAMGHGSLPVRRRPKIALLATGNELVLPGQPAGPDQIVCSNPFGLSALARQAGADPEFLGIARDTREDIAIKVAMAKEADILVTIGGASVGDHDLVIPVLKEMGLELDFWRIAMRPGMPFIFGRLARQVVLGLPGNPVSSLICGRIFMVPLIRRMLGLDEPGFAMEQMPLAAPLSANGPRQHYMRATLETTPDGRRAVSPVKSQDSSLLATLASAAVLIVRAPNAGPLPAGAVVTVIHLDF